MTSEESVVRWAVAGETLVICVGPGEMADPTLAPLLEEVRRVAANGCLAIGLGSLRMTVVQRTDAAQVLKQKGFKCVVMTDSRVTRGVLTAISWFGGDIEAAPLDDLEHALDKLQLTDPHRDEVRREATRLRGEVEDMMRQSQAG